MTTVRRSRTALFTAMFSVAFFLFSQMLSAGTVYTNAHPVPRVTKPVNDGKRVVLHGHVPRVIANASITGKAVDMGPIDPSTSLQGMRIVLQSSPEQSHELRRVIDEQQDKRTRNFHQWVTPEEFGSSFGVHDDDIQQVTNWLTKHGFTVDNVTKSKRVIQFSGTSGQVAEAFGTSLHSYQVNGETHVSVNSDISVPEALAPVIAGVDGLHDFFRKSHMVNVQKLSEQNLPGQNLPDQRLKELANYLKLGPAYTSSSSVHYVGPSDFATIYNTAPLLAQGINGTGQTIAIVGRSDILMSDVQTYRQLFNLPINDPIFIHAGQDNGTQPGDDGESDLDVEISGGIAPNATVKFVIGTPTFLVDGITNSIEYIVENNLADIMSISYGSCEAVEGAGGNAFNLQAFEQAAAQGISVFVAAGDGGPAGCDDQGSQTYEVLGYAVGAEAGTPYSVSVGGTEFYGDGGAGYSTYWNSSNNSLYQNSAITYIPEYPWNESRVASPTPTGEPASDFTDLWSGSGGISAYYLRPSWQQGSGINNLTDPTLTLGNGATGLWVSSVTITNPGSGYTTAPTVAFSGGGCTAEPAATSVIAGGQVTGLTFTGYTSHYQGFGCTSAPTIAFSGGGGTGAAATANVGPMQNPPPIISGVPHRLQPDLSLNAASGHDGTLFCSEGVCEINNAGQLTDAGIVGGTSVAAPSMAGVQALINQANGGRQGMPGYIYYTLANQQSASACNSSGPPGVGSNCAFQDITLGNNLICGLATGSCTATLTQAKIGFNAGTGYDLASGLGSPNAANLANQWKTVVFNSSTTTLNLSQTSGINHGTGVTLSGTVSGNAGTPTGDVAFIVSQGAISWGVSQVDGSPTGSPAFATLSGGSYSVNLNNLPGGSYTVTARYAGDANFASSLSAPVPVTVNSEATVVTITPQVINQTACSITNGSTFSYGQLAWIQVQVSGASGKGIPTGTATITVDGNTYSTPPLDPNGYAYLVAGTVPSSSCVYDYTFAQGPTLSGGSHTIGASYSGDATFQANTATPVGITVTPLTPTVTLTAGATLITSGFPDTLTATFGGLTALTGSGSQSSGPTGSVNFYDNTTSTLLGTATVVPTISFSGNIYTYGATAVLINNAGITATGANSIVAIYSGDSNYNTVTSTAVAVTVGTGTATTTTVTSSANPTTLNGRPTFTATITGAPTAGTVTFYDGTTTLGTGTVGSGHTATFRPASGYGFWGGAHNITATFGGNATFMASTSPVFVETVTQGTVTIVLSGKTVGNSGQNYTFAAVLTPSSTNATFAPNQSVVNFYDGATLIGSGQPMTITSGQGGYGLWTATMATSSLSAGTHTITATYTDINYSLGTSNTQTVYAGNGSPTQSQGIYSPLSPSTLTSTSVTFKWFPMAGANFWLDVGSTQGGNNYYQSGNIGTVLSATVNNLPDNGSPVWVTWWYEIGGTWSYLEYQYSTGGPGQITSPANLATLTGSSEVFTWTQGSATQFWITAGNAPGGNNYYSSGNLGNVLTTNVTGLPTDGSQVYVTLFSFVDGQWVYTQDTYTAYSSQLAQILTPTNNTEVDGASVMFTWTNPSNSDNYWLDIGSVPGGNDIYQSGNLGNVTTTTVNDMPNNGTEVYGTLWTLIGGQWYYNSYQWQSGPMLGHRPGQKKPAAAQKQLTER
ncbi:MAG: Ig-like domain repeat protein [Candidatus Korobacteraceae bacterium]